MKKKSTATKGTTRPEVQAALAPDASKQTHAKKAAAIGVCVGCKRTINQDGTGHHPNCNAA